MKNKDPQKPRKIEVWSMRRADIEDTNNPDSPTRLPEEVWEKMYYALYDYRFGRIDFLSLLDKWEEILQIKASSLKRHSTYQSHAHELPVSEEQE